MRSRQSLTHSRISHRFMEPEAQLPCSQETCTDPVHITPSDLSKTDLNIIVPLMSRSSQWPLPFWISHQILYAFLLCPCVLCVFLISSHPPPSGQPEDIWRRIQITKLRIMQSLQPSSVQIFSLAFCSQMPSVYLLLLM